MTSNLGSWTSHVDHHIAAQIGHTEQLLARTRPAGDDIVVALHTAARGGKRLRAHLLLAAHDAMGGQRAEAAVGCAAALEMFQTAALIHDDVIDDSDTRRGQPSAHRHFAAIHRSRGLIGGDVPFGAAGAILTGDISLLASMRCLEMALSHVEEPARTMTSSLFHDMTQLVTGGQYLDVHIAATDLAALASQLELIEATMRAKTASYTAEFPLAMGAAIAGTDHDTIRRWRAIGVPLGVAFQIRDDILGLLGAPDMTGKPVGDDLREGKRTVIVHHSWVNTDATGRRALAAALGNPTADQDTIDAAIRVIQATDSFAHAEQRIDALRTTALDELVALVNPGPARDYVVGIIDTATRRVA